MATYLAVIERQDSKERCCVKRVWGPEPVDAITPEVAKQAALLKATADGFTVNLDTDSVALNGPFA